MAGRDTFHRRLHQWLLTRGAIRECVRDLTIAGEDPWTLCVEFALDGLGTMRIRPARAADMKALKDFLNSLGERSLFLFAPYPMDERLDGTLQRVLDACAQNKNLVLHAWRGDEIAAHCFLDGLDRPRPELGIAVADACQGKGLGRLMLALLQGCAAALDRAEIGLTTHPSNENAFHLYRMSGFEQVGERRIRVADGSERVEREMVCVLPGPGLGVETGGQSAGDGKTRRNRKP